MKEMNLHEQFVSVVNFEKKIEGTIAEDWADEYTRYVNNNLDLIEEQLLLQNKDKNMTANDFVSKQKSMTTGETRSGNSLILKVTPILAKAIDEYKNRSQVITRRFIKNTDSNVIAYAVLKCMFNNSIHEASKTTFIAKKIGETITQEVKFDWLQKNEGVWTDTIQSNLFTTNQEFRQTNLRKNFRIFGERMNQDVENLNSNKTIQLGSNMIELVVNHTGLFELSKVNGIYYTIPKNELLEHLSTANEALGYMSGEKFPMICKPKPWTSISSRGGYLTHERSHNTSLIRGIRSNNLNKLKDNKILDTLIAVNAIQETPWIINKNAIERLEYMMEVSGQELAEKLDISTIEEIPLPELTETIKNNKELLLKWRRDAQKIYLKRTREGSKRSMLLKKIWIAKMFKDNEEIYFPHCLDFRGRVYPVTTILNSQGDDASKSLLMFKEAKPLGERGLRWLKIHVANLIGWDKLSFDNRVEMVDKEIDNIRDAVKNFESNDYWLNWDKPFYGLSCAEDLINALDSGNPHSYESRIPIAVDGSCSGIQHYSCLLRDEVGAHAVNLMPVDSPNDIYKIVSDKLTQLLNDNESENSEKLRQFVDRSLTKRAVMTTAYGVTSRGIVDQIFDLQKKKKWEWDYDFIKYTAGMIEEAISQSVIGAVQGMDFLKECSRVVAKSKQEVKWMTPNGFTVIQTYEKTKRQSIKCFSGVVNLKVMNGTGEVDTAKGTSSVAPNYIHSFDASHLCMTTVTSKENGINNFAMIHDSFGTHACDVDTLVDSLLLELQNIYSIDNLQVFKEEMEEILENSGNAELIDNLPDLPVYGEFDLSILSKAEYAFS